MSERIDVLRGESGNITYSDPLTSFLYTLMRDYLPAGSVEKLILETVDNDIETIFTNGWLAKYANNLANMLYNAKNLHLEKSLEQVFLENDSKKKNTGACSMELEKRLECFVKGVPMPPPFECTNPDEMKDEEISKLKEKVDNAKDDEEKDIHAELLELSNLLKNNKYITMEDAKDVVFELQSKGEISEDDSKRILKELDKMKDDEISKLKEKVDGAKDDEEKDILAEILTKVLKDNEHTTIEEAKNIVLELQSKGQISEGDSKRILKELDEIEDCDAEDDIYTDITIEIEDEATTPEEIEIKAKENMEKPEVKEVFEKLGDELSDEMISELKEKLDDVPILEDHEFEIDPVETDVTEEHVDKWKKTNEELQKIEDEE